MGTILIAYQTPSRRCKARQTTPKVPAANSSTLENVAARCPFRREPARAVSPGTRLAAPLATESSPKSPLARPNSVAHAARQAAWAWASGAGVAIAVPGKRETTLAWSLPFSANDLGVPSCCWRRPLVALPLKDTSRVSWAEAETVATKSARMAKRSAGCRPRLVLRPATPGNEGTALWPATGPAVHSCSRAPAPSAQPHLTKQPCEEPRRPPPSAEATIAASPARARTRRPCGSMAPWRGHCI
mmetsp:Transcript_75249/g.243310  ORF Transcript_75249/g.243310 Transcript_75249/m.243310 type:complete len:244 (+) Transcript_75249:1283-2014(+)